MVASACCLGSVFWRFVAALGSRLGAGSVRSVGVVGGVSWCVSLVAAALLVAGSSRLVSGVVWLGESFACVAWLACLCWFS
jgi:hypothetical protein